jgi:flagellar motor protein MotB
VSKHERHEEEQEDEERWLITYADMITLLMAFFIMMYSMSVVDLKKFEALSESARHVFGGKMAGVGTGATRSGGGLLKGGRGLMEGLGNLGANRASLVNQVKRELDEGLTDR